MSQPTTPVSGPKTIAPVVSATLQLQAVSYTHLDVYKRQLPDLQSELIAVISKYIKINPDDIKVNLERQDNLEVREVKSELPDSR